MLKQKLEVDFVLDAFQSMIVTSAEGREKSRNLSLLSQQLSDNHNSNIDLFICGSSLFQWAEQDIFRHHTCRLQRQNIPSHEAPPSDESRRRDELTTHHTLSGFQPARLSLVASGSLSNPAWETPDRSEIRRRRKLAKMHSLYGVPVQHVHRGKSTTTSRYDLRSESAPIHPYARSKVYDLRQHTEHSLWGPFLDDGSQEVDWEKIEVIMLMLDHNLSCFKKAHEVFNENALPDWSKPFSGATPFSYVPKKAKINKEPMLPLEAQDPYNVTGTWMRVVCFLDYTELYNFNFEQDFPAANEPRPPLDTEEATRLITMRIQVTKIEPPGAEDGQGMPVVHFRGTSSSVRPSWDPNANSSIRGVQIPLLLLFRHADYLSEQGMVKLTPQGDVRWTTWSIFHG